MALRHCGQSGFSGKTVEKKPRSWLGAASIFTGKSEMVF